MLVHDLKISLLVVLVTLSIFSLTKENYCITMVSTFLSINRETHKNAKLLCTAILEDRKPNNPLENTIFKNRLNKIYQDKRGHSFDIVSESNLLRVSRKSTLFEHKGQTHIERDSHINLPARKEHLLFKIYGELNPENSTEAYIAPISQYRSNHDTFGKDIEKTFKEHIVKPRILPGTAKLTLDTNKVIDQVEDKKIDLMLTMLDRKSSFFIPLSKRSSIINDHVIASGKFSKEDREKSLKEDTKFLKALIKNPHNSKAKELANKKVLSLETLINNYFSVCQESIEIIDETKKGASWNDVLLGDIAEEANMRNITIEKAVFEHF
jgi:hypothetical protein